MPRATYLLYGSLTLFGETVSTDARFVDVTQQKALVVFSQTGSKHGDIIEHIDLFSDQVKQEVFGLQVTTVQRVISKRGKRVYLDFLQNRRGLTIASAYSVRPRAGATVSAPLNWSELDQDFVPEDFNVQSMKERLDRVGDLWVSCRTDSNDVREVLELL